MQDIAIQAENISKTFRIPARSATPAAITVVRLSGWLSVTGRPHEKISTN